MKIAFACDHAGFRLKQDIIRFLSAEGQTVIDLGTNDESPVDYPDYAEAIAKAIQSGTAERGVLICGSGVGAAVAINKFVGLRGSVCHDTYSAHQGVEHDDINVLCLGARIIGAALALELVGAFIHAQFSGEERHQRRLKKIAGFEKRSLSACQP